MKKKSMGAAGEQRVVPPPLISSPAAKAGAKAETPPKEDKPKAKKTQTPPQKKQRGFISKLIRRYFIVFTLLAAALFSALCTRSYIDQLTYAFSYVALNYAEAGKGLAPNSTRYNMYDFTSDELMARVIELAALDNVSPEELSGCVGIAARGGGGSDYISSGYTLSVELSPLKNKNLHIDALSLLHLIQKAYTQMFYETSVARADALLFDFASKSKGSMEFRELSDYLALHLTVLDNYVSGRMIENNVFRSGATGLTFRDIKERIQNLRSVDLENLNAYIDSTGAVRSKADYLAKLSYINYRNTEKYQRAFSEYSVRLSNVSLYDIFQSATVMVPTYNQQGEFYMSMTKTGVDNITLAAQNYNVQAAQLRASLAATDSVIKNIRAEKDISQSAQKAGAMLAALDEDIKELTGQTLLTDSDYIEYKTGNYITFTDAKLSTSQKIEFSKNALISLAFYLLLWYIGWRRLAGLERKVV